MLFLIVFVIYLCEVVEHCFSMISYDLKLAVLFSMQDWVLCLGIAWKEFYWFVLKQGAALVVYTDLFSSKGHEWGEFWVSVALDILLIYFNEI